MEELPLDVLLKGTVSRYVTIEDKSPLVVADAILSADDTLKQSEEKYRLLITRMQQGFAVNEWIFDELGKVTDYRFIEVNESFEKMTRLKQNDIIGKTMLEIMPITGGYWIEKYGNLAITGETLIFEDYLEELHKYFEVVAYFTCDKQFEVIMTDITDRKLAELALIKALKDNERLLFLSKESERLKTEFFSNISHELRTPLAVIFITLKLAELDKIKYKEVSKKKVDERNEIIKRNALRLLRMVNNFLDLIKVDTGYMTLNLKNRDIVKTIKELVPTAENYASIKAIAIEFQSSIIENTMAFDYEKIHRIVLNLISNAIKFTPSGGQVNIFLLQDQDMISISVQDTGIGIPKEMFNNIFERFRQVNNTFVRNSEGIGIGLSLVKAFVEMHGGKIVVESEVGKGSKFCVLLPIRTVEEDVIDLSQFCINSFNPEQGAMQELSDIGTA